MQLIFDLNDLIESCFGPSLLLWTSIAPRPVISRWTIEALLKWWIEAPNQTGALKSWHYRLGLAILLPSYVSRFWILSPKWSAYQSATRLSRQMHITRSWRLRSVSSILNRLLLTENMLPMNAEFAFQFQIGRCMLNLCMQTLSICWSPAFLQKCNQWREPKSSTFSWLCQTGQWKKPLSMTLCGVCASLASELSQNKPDVEQDSVLWLHKGVQKNLPCQHFTSPSKEARADLAICMQNLLVYMSNSS